MIVIFANDDVVWITCIYVAEEHVPILRQTNDLIGAYVPASARIHLYRCLERLGENAIYCDTDSVKYIEPRDGHELIGTGDKFGDMVSELRPSEFLSAKKLRVQGARYSDRGVRKNRL